MTRLLYIFVIVVSIGIAEDATAQCASVTAMTCGTTYSGTLAATGSDWSSYTSCSYSEPGDEVVYSYTPASTASYTFSTTTSSGDPDFFLMNSCGNTGTNVYGSCWSSGNITITLSGGITYYLIVDNYSSSATAGYTVSVSCASASPCSSVTAMSCGTTYSGTLAATGSDWSSYTSCSYSEPGDEVVYSYTPASTGSYTFSTTTTSGDPDFFLMNSCGNTGTNVYGSCWSSGNISVTLTGGVTYYLIVDNYSSSSTAGYTVSVACAGGVSPCSSVTAMSCGTTYSATLATTGSDWSSYTSCSYTEPGDEVVYSFTPVTTGSHTFTTTTTSGDPDFFLMSSCGNTGTNIYGSCWGSGNITVTLTAGVTYYFIADNYSSSATAAFTVSITCPLTGPCASTTAMACGITYSGTLAATGNDWSTYTSCATSEPGDEVVYSYTPATSESFTFTTTTTSGNPDFFLMSSCGNTGTNLTGGCWASGNATVSLTAGVTYYLIVDNASSSATAGYTVSVSCPTTGSCASPTAMTCGTTYSGTLPTSGGSWTTYTGCTYSEPGGELVFTYTPTTTMSYTFATSTTSGDADFFLMSTCGNTGTNIYGSCWSSGNVTVPLTAGVTYYIIADNYSSSSTAAFTLSVGCPPTPPPVQPPCTNLGFESGFTGWYGTLGNSTDGASGASSPVYTATSFNTTTDPNFTLMTSGTDPYGGFPCVFSGGTSLRIGDVATYETYNAATIEQTFTVTTSNSSFTYNYAVVLQDGGSGHTDNIQPYFKIGVYDQSGNEISCGMYLVVAPGSGFTLAPGYTDIYYKPWTTVSVNLSSYLGQNVTIRILASDCSWGAHFGYAYLDCSCNSYGIINPAVICLGQSATLSAPPGALSYSWTPGGQSTSSITVSPTVTTNYTCNITTQGNVPCNFSLITSVTVNSTPSVTVNSPSICSGGSATLTATPSLAGGTYLWSPGGQATQSITVSPTSTTPYTVTYTNGCVSTATGTVTVLPSLTLTPSASPSTICLGGTSSLSATSSVAGTTFSWMPGSLSGSPVTVSPTSTTTYTVTGTASGCTSVATVTVNVSPSLSITIVPTPATICIGSSSSLLASGATSYNWSGGLGTANPLVVSPTSTTTYTVTGTSGGCNGTAATTVTVSPTLAISIVPTPATICSGSSSSLMASGGTTYNWSGGLGSANPLVASPTSTTSYTVTGTTLGCTGQASVTVNVNPIPSMTAPANIVVCNNGTVAASSFSSTPAGATYAWTNTNTSIGLAASGSGNVPSFTATNTGTTPISGTISVTPTLAGCTGTPVTYSITVNPTDNPAFNYTPSSFCQTGTDTPANITGGATGTFSASPAGLVFLNTSTGLIDVSASTIGSYTVTFTTGGSCPSSANTTVNIISAPLATFSYGGPYCLYNTDPAPTLGAGASAGVFSSTAGLVFVSTSTGVVDLSASTPGTYTVTNSIAAAGGCLAVSATATIVINATPTVTVPAAFAVCNGASVPAATITGTPAGVTYAWTNSNTAIGLATSGTGVVPAFTATNTGATPITATITVTPSANGCTGTPQSYVITVNPTPTVNVPANITVCNNNTVAATSFTSPTAGATYAWTNTNTSIGIGANGTGNIPSFTAVNTSTSPVTATITVTPTANGCVGTASSYTITVNPTPVVTVPANIIVCNNAAVAAANFTSTTAGATFTWTNSNTGIGLAASGSGNISGFTATNTGSSPITSTITVTPSANGCTGTPSSYTITVNATPLVNVPANITVCNNATVSAATFTSSTAGTTYTWTNTNTTIGLGASGSGNIPGFTATNTGSSAVTATITVTPSANGCTGTPSSYTITVNPSPTVSVPANVSLCTGATVPALNFSSTTPGATFAWTNSNTSIGLGASGTGNIAAFTANNTNTTASTATITVTPSANGCAGTPSTFTITVNPLPSLSFPALTGLCVNAASFTLNSASPAGGTYSGTGVSAGSFNPATAGAGTHTITYSYTDANGCTNSITQTITVYPIPVVSITPQNPTICLGTSVSLNAAGATTYAWSPSTGLSSPTGNMVTASPLATTTYVVTGTANGCSNTDDVTVSVYTSIPVTVNPTSVNICPGVSTQLTASGGATYVWSPATGLSSTTGSSVTASPSTTTVYNVVGSDLGGCSGSASVTVTINPLNMVSFLAVPTEGCVPLTVNFLFVPGSGIMDDSWVWNFGDNTTSTDSMTNHVYTSHGSYIVTLNAQTVDGCAVQASDTINAYQVPVADFIIHPDITTTEDPIVGFFDESLHTNIWTWNFGDPSAGEANTSNLQNPSYEYTTDGVYNVMLIAENQFGCVDTLIKTVTVYQAFAFWVPNAFSPNEDGVNDVFLAKGVGYKEETFVMRVLDRWGKILYYSEDINKGWDGIDYNSGKHQPEGVYIYQILITDQSMHEHVYKGHITLVK